MSFTERQITVINETTKHVPVIQKIQVSALERCKILQLAGHKNDKIIIDKHILVSETIYRGSEE